MSTRSLTSINHGKGVEMPYDLIIGIDPDVDKSGFAIYSHEQKELKLAQFDLSDIFFELSTITMLHTALIRLEAGHKIKKTWQRRTVGVAKDIGRNNEIGSQIEKYLVKNNIPHELVPPFGGSQVNHDLFCKITGWDVKKRTNPETRVAGLLAFNCKSK